MKRVVFTLLVLLIAALPSCRHSSRSAAASSLRPSMPVVSGVTNFSFHLYRQLAAGNKENVLVSPLSISSALSMPYIGSRNETALEMAQTLGYPSSVDVVAQGFGWLQGYLTPQGDSSFELASANGLWLQSGLKLEHDFLETMRDHYRSHFFEVDFSKDPAAALEKINGQVAEETGGKIDQLLSPDAVNQSTQMVVTSSLYLKAPWSSPFSSQNTRSEPFHLPGGGTVQVPMMHQTAQLPYYKGTGFAFLKLPFARDAHGPRLAMLLLMPDNPRHLGLVERRITPKALREGMGRFQMRQVEVGLPRFSLKTDLPLAPILSKMGMSLPFSDRADFSGIDGERDLLIQQVSHGVVLNVDEAGTEAAAATAVSMGVKSMPMGQTVRFYADHPFLFMIVEEQTGAVLFMGRLTRPQ